MNSSLQTLQVMQEKRHENSSRHEKSLPCLLDSRKVSQEHVSATLHVDLGHFSLRHDERWDRITSHSTDKKQTEARGHSQ